MKTLATSLNQSHSGGAIEGTNTPGRYHAKLKIDMSGDWNAKISFDGPRTARNNEAPR